MPRMVCVRDGVEFRVIKNEVVLAQPDALWYGDLWRCPTCGAEVVAGIGQEPFLEAWRGDIGAEVVKLWKAGAVIINKKAAPRPKPHYVPSEHSKDEAGAPITPDLVRGLGAAVPRGREGFYRIEADCRPDSIGVCLLHHERHEPPEAECSGGGPHSRVEAGTCTKCGNQGETLA